MKKEKKEVDFQLTQELTYSKAGKHETTATIIMHAPSMETFDEATNLGQLVMRAFADSQERTDVGGFSKEMIEEAKEKVDEGFDGSTIKMIVMSSKSIKFVDVANEFKRLAVKTCFVATDLSIKNPMFDKMDLNDFTRMVCEYISNFIAPSLFSE